MGPALANTESTIMGTQNQNETVTELLHRLARAHYGEKVDLTAAWIDDGDGNTFKAHVFEEVAEHEDYNAEVVEDDTEPAVIFGRFAVIDGSIRRLEGPLGYCDVAPGTDEVFGFDFTAARAWCKGVHDRASEAARATR